MTSEKRYGEMVKAFARRPCASEDCRDFGSDALKVCGRIFAMLSSSGRFVVQLPRRRSTSSSTRANGTDSSRGSVA